LDTILLLRSAARPADYGGSYLYNDLMQDCRSANNRFGIRLVLLCGRIIVTSLSVLGPHHEAVGPRIHQDRTRRPRIQGGMPYAATARTGPLPAVWMAGRHAGLVGVVVRAILSKAVLRLGVYQCEPVPERLGVVGALQQASVRARAAASEPSDDD
jgi:hypothetical protein